MAGKASGVPPCPEPFIEVRLDRIDLVPPVSAGCAGFELNAWRASQLAKHLLQWLPEFALKYSEWRDISAENAVAQVGRAAKAIYATDRFENRGECGELLLHVLLRQHFSSIPAISKIYFKDSRNDTVKGFDAVHVVQQADEWELWLGEVKFYTQIKAAIRDAIAEIKAHLDPTYLRGEFTVIRNKLDREWPGADDLYRKLAENRPIDDIFSAICVPILLGYNSEVVQNHASVSEVYLEEFEAEALLIHEEFRGKLPSLPVRVHLLLFPMANKSTLLAEWDNCLKSCQELI